MAASDNIVLVDSTAAPRTITLPAPTNGRVLFVKDLKGTSSTNNITINPHSSETIDGLSSYILSQNYESVEFTSDGTNWSVIAEANSTGTINAINQLTGDVTAGPATGSQSEAATVAKIQGTTVSGTTGSGNVVFSASPTLTGTITAAAANFSGAISASNFSGSSSGTNTGDQTITLTGDVTGSGTGSFAATIASNAVTNAKLAQMATHTLKGNNTGSTANASDLTVSQVNTMLGDILANGTVAFTAAQSMGGFNLTNVADPVSSQDAATKNYVDSAINGLTWKGPAQAYANSNVPLTGGATLTIDGYSVQNGDLVILGNQTTASQNGEYSASGIGSSYTLTANGQPSAAGDAWLILNGTLYANSAFVATAAVPAAAFVEFAGPNAYSFTAPLDLSGNTVSITQSNTSTDGYLSSTDWNTFNNKQPAGSYITALTGDATASGPGSSALTLATVNSNVGSFGSSTSIPSFTVNAKGLITAASGNAVVAPAGTLSGTTLNSSVVNSSLTSVGTLTSLTVAGAISASNFSGSSSGTNTGDITLAAIGSSPNANAASLSGQVLNLQPASASFGGVVTTGSQTLAGDKTLTGNTLIAQATASQATIGISGSSAQHQINGGLVVTTNTVSSNYAIV